MNPGDTPAIHLLLGIKPDKAQSILNGKVWRRRGLIQ